MYRLYIANKNYSSWSLRPWVLMRELGLAFAESLVPFGKPGAFRAFSPSGRVPCLHDGKLVIWDSLAIVEYLAECYPSVWPADPTARAWARSAAAEMHSGFAGLRNICSMNCGLRLQIDEYPQDLLVDLARINELWSDGFARFGGPFLAGATFTAVDAFFAPVAFRVQTFALELAELPGRYVNRLLALPAMQEWYNAALGEVWRDEQHERDILQVGSLLADLRQA
jgi:glutathione S-transferase